jgi:hypothetical protein
MKDENCSRVQDLLPEYEAGTLSSETAGSIRSHLAQCAECRSEAELLSLVRSSDVVVPEGLEARVVSALRAGVPQGLARSRGIKQYALAATVAFVAITGSWIWQATTRSEENRPVDNGVAPLAEDDAPALLRSPGLSALSEDELLALLKEIES